MRFIHQVYRGTKEVTLSQAVKVEVEACQSDSGGRLEDAEFRLRRLTALFAAVVEYLPAEAQQALAKEFVMCDQIEEN